MKIRPDILCSLQVYFTKSCQQTSLTCTNQPFILFASLLKVNSTSREFTRILSLFLFQYNSENSREFLGMLVHSERIFREFPGIILGNSREIPGYSWNISHEFEGNNQPVNWRSHSKELQEKAYFGDGFEWLPESIWTDTTWLDYRVFIIWKCLG